MAHRSSNNPVFIAVNTGAAHAGIYPTFSSYGSSKIASAQLVSFLQTENPDVRVVSMHPGVIETEMNVKSGMPMSRDDMSLPSDFAVWLAAHAYKEEWTAGRFLWSHWDVDELVKMKEEIVGKNELVLALNGWPKEVSDMVVVA